MAKFSTIRRGACLNYQISLLKRDLLVSLRRYIYRERERESL